MDHRLQILAWGGSPIQDLLSSPGITKEDYRLIHRWGEFLTDPQYETEWILAAEQGHVWIDTRSSTGQHRILLRVVPESRQGTRRVWNYFAYQYPIISPNTPADWAQILKQLTSQPPTLPQDDEIVVNFSEENPTTYLRSAIRYQLDREFYGEYETTLNDLCRAITSSSWNDLSDLTIACNPPRSDVRFRALIRSGNYWSTPPRLLPFTPDHKPRPPSPPRRFDPCWNYTKMIRDRIKQMIVRPGVRKVLLCLILASFCFMAGHKCGDQRGFARAEMQAQARAEKLAQKKKNSPAEWLPRFFGDRHKAQEGPPGQAGVIKGADEPPPSHADR